MRQIDYSVVVPVFNSEATLEELHRRITRVFGDLEAGFEVIYVDDGSTDSSWQVLGKLKDSDPDHVTAVRLARNFGQHNATFCGFSFMKGRYLVTLDDDLQNPPEEITKLIEARDSFDADLVYGVYQDRKHSKVRNLGSKYFTKTSNLFGRKGQGSAFRLLSKEIVEKVLVHHQNFIFIEEVLQWYTDYVCYVVVEHHKRKVKKSGYTPRKIISLLANILIYYTAIPLKIMVYGGLFSSGVFFVMSVIFAFKKIFFNVPLGYTSLIVAILFSTSIILFCLGIIGEYLSRIYLVQNKKPPYSVKKVL